MPVADHRVFDCHLHVQPWHEIRPAVRALLESERAGDLAQILSWQKDPQNLIDFLDEEGIDRAVLVNYVAPDVSGFTEAVNPWVAELCRHHPDRLVPMGSVHPHRVDDVEAAVDALVGLGIRAFKVHPSHQLYHPLAYLPEFGGDERVGTLWRTLEARGIPVTVHTGTSVFPGARNRYADPMLLDDVAVDFPNLTLILAHCGRPLWTDAAEFLARRHPNVHLELSGIPPKRLLHYLPRLESLSHKVLFGSDYPGPGVRSVRGNVEAFLDLPIGDAAKRAILWGNAEQIFGA